MWKRKHARGPRPRIALPRAQEPPARRGALVPLLLSLFFALLCGGGFIAAVAAVGSMASLFSLPWTFHLMDDSKEGVVLLGGVVFLLSLAPLAVGVTRGTSGFEKMDGAGGFLRVMALGVGLGFLFAFLLLGILITTWMLAFLLPEPGALGAGAVLMVALFSVPLLRKKLRKG